MHWGCSAVGLSCASHLMLLLSHLPHLYLYTILISIK
jgi:hypothetical protein